MKQRIMSGPFSLLSIAKIALFKLMVLSTAALFAPSAFAAKTASDAPLVCLDINPYLPRYVSSHNHFIKYDHFDWDNEWTLSWNIPDYRNRPYSYLPKKNGITTFKLKSIKIKTVPFTLKDANGDPNENDPIIVSVLCEYTDPNVNGNLHLELKPSGKIEVIDENNPNKDQDGKEITDRTVRYVSRGGSIYAYTQWEYDKEAAVVKDFTCSGTENLKTNCGGWNFQRVIQNNGFWSDAFAKCNRYLWKRCYFNNSYNWSYVADLRSKHNTMKWDEDRSYCIYEGAFFEGSSGPCRLLNAKNAFCTEPKCEAEIAAINNIIGTNPADPDREGMGWYARACWADPNLKFVWKKMNWEARFETCDDRRQPVEDWPNYSHLSLPG